jgi:hypothetical protein
LRKIDGAKALRMRRIAASSSGSSSSIEIDKITAAQIAN